MAFKVHHDTKISPNHDCIGKISKASAEEIVPESLFMLISLLCSGYQEEFQESHDDVKTRILSICQDIIFLSSRGHKLTPKHIGIGLTVHQATRSKQLVQLLHAAGHSVNYDTVLRMDNTIANDVLERYRESGNVFVPRNFTGTTDPAGYTRFAVDDIDINEETLNGMGTFHATQVAAFRRKEEGEPAMDIECLLSRDSLDGDLKVQGNDAPQKWQVHCYYHGRGPIQQGKDAAMGKDTSAQRCHHCAWRFSHADDFFKSHREVLTVIRNGGDVGRE